MLHTRSIFKIPTHKKQLTLIKRKCVLRLRRQCVNVCSRYSQPHSQTFPRPRAVCPSCRTRTPLRCSWRRSSPSRACPAWSSAPERAKGRVLPRQWTKTNTLRKKDNKYPIIFGECLHPNNQIHHYHIWFCSMSFNKSNQIPVVLYSPGHQLLYHQHDLWSD